LELIAFVPAAEIDADRVCAALSALPETADLALRTRRDDLRAALVRGAPG